MLNSQVKDKKLLSPRITIVKAKDGESSISMKSRCQERENWIKTSDYTLKEISTSKLHSIATEDFHLLETTWPSSQQTVTRLRYGTSTRSHWLLRAEATTSHSISRAVEVPETCKCILPQESGGRHSDSIPGSSSTWRTERHSMLRTTRMLKDKQSLWPPREQEETNNGMLSTSIRLVKKTPTKSPTIMASKLADLSTSCQECICREFFTTKLVSKWRSCLFRTTKKRDNNSHSVPRQKQSHACRIQSYQLISWVKEEMQT